MKRKLLILFLINFFIVIQTFAQTHSVTGTVTAKDNGQSLPGVSVSIKGSNTGTQTDVNGKYSITVPAGAQLIFSFIGYTTQIITVHGDVENVALISSTQQLGEVVVT